MDMHGVSRLIEVLSYSVLLVSVSIIAHSNLSTCVRLQGLAGFLLGLTSVLVGVLTGDSHLFMLAVMAILIKGCAIPWYLLRVIGRIGILRRTEKSLSMPTALLFTAALTLLASHVSKGIAQVTPVPTRDIVASSLATMFIGLLLMMTCQKALTQMVGFLIMEDGIFLFAITQTYGMPLLVELGIFFDLMVAVGITGIMVLRISGSFNHIDVSQLNSLKG